MILLIFSSIFYMLRQKGGGNFTEFMFPISIYLRKVYVAKKTPLHSDATYCDTAPSVFWSILMTLIWTRPLIGVPKNMTETLWRCQFSDSKVFSVHSAPHKKVCEEGCGSEPLDLVRCSKSCFIIHAQISDALNELIYKSMGRGKMNILTFVL